MKLKEMVFGAWCLVPGAKKTLAAALCAVGLAAFADGPEGSKENPWQIGSPNAADVTAWTNGTGKLVIEGTGDMMDFTDEAPWCGCQESIKSVEIAEGVTSIGEFAFSRCTGLESVTIPERVSSIGIGAFDQCTSLSTVTFAAESQLKTIGSIAFSDCLKLGSVEIPASVTRIAVSAFGRCSSLSNVTVRATVPPWNEGRTFDECNALVAIYVPYRTGEAYRSADGWKDYAGMIIDGYTLKIPAAKTGYSYVVSNATEELSGVLANGTNSYLVAVGDAVKVHFTLAEGYKWAEDTPPSPLDLGTMTADKTVDEDDLPTIIPPGCKENPWQIGSPNAADVTAWTNGTELVVQGRGAVAKLVDAIKGWDGIKVGITAINVASDGILGAVENAFSRLGDPTPVALTLPDGWQGEFPDKDGNWYGAKVELTAMPLTVRNVAFQQRWPWNGMVDIVFDVTGPEGETNVDVTVYTNETKAANFTAAVAIPESGVLATNLVWNAAGLGEDFKSDAVTIAVTVDATTVVAKSEQGTVDVRTSVTLPRYGTAVAGVRYSDTAWGAVDEVEVTLGYTNETTGATGVLAEGLTGEDVTEVELPKKDGAYRLTHSTGGFKSFVTFTVTGFRGTEGDPWEIGAGEDKTSVRAWTNENGLVTRPMRGTALVKALDGIKKEIGVLPDMFWVISDDGSATNEVQMLLGSDGKAYDTLAEVLAANPQPETVRLFEVKGYWVSYDRGGNDGQGEPQPDPADAIPDMATDMFVPTVPTNLTANAYVRTNFVFDCWLGWTNGVRVTYLDGAKGVDFCEPGATLALTAQWTRVIVPVTVPNLEHTTVSVTTNGVEVERFATVEDPAGFIYNVQTNADVTIVYRAVSGWAFDAAGTNGTVVLPNVTWSVNDFVPEEALPTVVPITSIITEDDVEAGPDGTVIIKSCHPTADGVLIIPKKIDNKIVKAIAGKAFQYATWLKELVIEEGLTEIGNAAFDNCSGLALVKIPASVMKVGQVAFMRCFALERLEFAGDAPAMQKLAKLGYGICWGAHGFDVKTVPGTEGWGTALNTLCEGWQTFSGPVDGVYTCTYDPKKIVPRITGVERLSKTDTSLTINNVKKGLTYTLEGAETLDGEWKTLKTVVGGDADTLVFAIPGDTGTSAFFRVTVRDASDK